MLVPNFSAARLIGAQDPIPAYTTGTIYLFVDQKQPVTVPFDDLTTLPDATVYSGVIKNVDGSPAAGANFSAQTSPNISSNRPVQTNVTGTLMHADHQGRLRFAVKSSLCFHSISISGTHFGNSEWSRSQEEFSLVPGQQNVLVSRLRKSLPVRLTLADGTELTSATIARRDHILKPSSWLLGRCASLPPDHPYSGAEVSLNRSSGTHSFTLNNLAVPGKYNIMVDGRVFKPFFITADDSELTLQEDERPFTLTGRLLDPAGKPVTGAMVILDNDSSDQLRKATFDSVKQAWQKSSGQYDNLGFYMAKTDSAGRYEISGTCAGSFSSLFVHGDGFQPASRRQLFSGYEQTSPALNSVGFRSVSRNFSKEMFTGSKELKPVVLAQQAILKIGPVGGPSMQGKSVRFLRTPLLGNEPVTWDLKATQEGGKTVFTVPAEIPFDIIWVGEGKYSISIKTPLKPGEERDLGDQKWVGEK